MTQDNKKPTHPGKILITDFLEPYRMTQVDLARYLEIPVQQIKEIVAGKRAITAETAWLLAQAFETPCSGRSPDRASSRYFMKFVTQLKP